MKMLKFHRTSNKRLEWNLKPLMESEITCTEFENLFSKKKKKKSKKSSTERFYEIKKKIL